MTSTASAPALDETAIEINRMRREWDELSRERDSYVARIEAMHSETAADRIKRSAGWQFGGCRYTQSSSLSIANASSSSGIQTHRSPAC